MIHFLIAVLASLTLPLLALLRLIDDKREQRRINRLMLKIEKCPEELQSKSVKKTQET